MSRKDYGTGGITTERMAMAMAIGLGKYISYSGDLKGDDLRKIAR